MSVFLTEFDKWKDENGDWEKDTPQEVKDEYARQLEFYADMTGEVAPTGVIINL